MNFTFNRSSRCRSHARVILCAYRSVTHLGLPPRTLRPTVAEAGAARQARLIQSGMVSIAFKSHTPIRKKFRNYAGARCSPPMYSLTGWRSRYRRACFAT
jgi:hypothetical protein